MKDKELCHGRDEDTKGKVVEKAEDGEWERFGDLWVKCTFGTEDLTELLVEYAKGLAELSF